jgi:geranylgeranyl diphosphate synthase, type II
MDPAAKFETLLEALLNKAENGAPPTLAAAMHHAVFPSGARVRPKLCLAVSMACGGDSPESAAAAAAAIELLHCASLVHDDLPCFDDADLRRGRASVHAAFGESTAVLAGDALIVLAFETLAQASPQRLPLLLSTIASGVGMPRGIVAGQAWESETGATAETCRRAKTGALFVTATAAGAIASGADPKPWMALGERLGEAYQVADDLLDAVTAREECGKPVGRDVALARPSAVRDLGLDGAVARLKELIQTAIDVVPECRGAAELRELVRLQAMRLAPKTLVRSAA